MEELAPDDPLNAFHEIFHRHVAVIMRFGRFPHRNKVLQRANTPAEEEFLENNLFRFDLPLVRQPDGSLAFAGTVKKRTVKLLDHEYQTLLPGAGEAPRGTFEFKYAGPGRGLHQDAGAAEEAGLHPHRRHRPRLHRRDQHGPDPLPRVHRRRLVRAVLAPGRLHAGLHHRARRHRQARGRVEQARHQGHRPQRRRRRGPRALDRRHQRDPAHAGELSDHRRQGPPGVDAVRHARPDHLPPRGRASARP